MTQTITPEQMLAMINERRNKIAQEYTNPRELLLANIQENPTFLQKPREEYKNKRIKEVNNVSRDAHEESDGTCPSDPLGSASQGVSPEGLEGQLGQEEGVVEIAAGENYTSRSYSGVEAFHCKTPKGVKINLTFQTPDEADLGACVALTAELKRQERFREIADYEGDEDYFKEFVTQVKKVYQKDHSADWCLGRAHARGKRSEWFANLLVLAKIENGLMTEVRIWSETEDYTVAMDMALNANQQQYFHAGGRYGSVKSKKRVPSLRTAERTLYR